MQLLFPPGFPLEACTLLATLLDRCPEARLPCAKGTTALKSHPFFAGVDWAAMASHSAPPPESLQLRLQAFPGLHCVPWEKSGAAASLPWVREF